MSLRASVVSALNPGVLSGVAFGDWVKLLRDNRLNIAPSRLPRALVISLQAVQTSVLRRRENRRFGPSYEKLDVSPPLFILGHWRSGTTHLHNLVTIDDRFAYPNNYQVFFPHTFLSTEAFTSRITSKFWPERRPMDNVAWSVQSPQEDELALCVSSLMSPSMGWLFLQNRDHYNRYMTLRDVPEREVAHWRECFLRFLRKLTLKYERPLVLKSPAHTCRIKLLLEMFPDARFVHIHRDPFAVFQSYRRTARLMMETSFHRARKVDLEEWILREYRVMYDAFFEERRLIPDGQYHEMSFEELERDPFGQMKDLYEALNLPDFAQAEPALRRYLDSIADYKKNEFASLPDELRRRIAEAWSPCFEEWGYRTHCGDATTSHQEACIQGREVAEKTE
jgi:omega-hydroxy-beta-dihydromenaquinone-9 sulfotransferase